ncbi:poly-gamma-glutamate biosynthesis protein PgsC [Longispora fulva]|uniref:Poly-gamma-glutamate biosynthesis protein PgsC/CapC n=1 Tax=Longispora fulva TaxID=619741 RepID=A0A8J7GHX0_9ACTN|nr:poly-gamma-glutamate biosynthesis protein PgsC/CapC [Longispora fulva]MBG6136942.1 poly-gamma-glutamate biosynthesis protein PgsC/CapC [Longispora fulva]GIG61705.1 poly-gamma-glutamate biosynthesis protein PgsC [Longispora fulva]
MITVELAPETATLALGAGLVFSLLCYLMTNLSPGGMITPGWLALSLLQDYRQAALVVVMTAVTYGATVLLQKVVILYGKRLFAAVVLLSVVLQLCLFALIQHDFPLLFVHETLGFVAPGLIAYQLVRQPPLTTILATVTVSAAAYAVMISGVLAGVVPSV